MKQVLLFLCIALFCTSFRPGDEAKDKGSFTATIDGEHFQCESQMLRGILVNKEASMDGRTPARTVISTNFKGPAYNMDAGRMFAESVEFEITYKDQKTGPAADYVVVLQYKSTNYFLVKEQSKMNIGQLSWDADKKHFWLAADFDCKMRSMGYPNDGKKDVSLKGSMTDIRITVPSWIAAKLN